MCARHDIAAALDHAEHNGLVVGSPSLVHAADESLVRLDVLPGPPIG